MKAIEENEKNQRCKNRRLSNDRDYKYKKLTLKEIDEAIDLGENLEYLYTYQKLYPGKEDNMKVAKYRPCTRKRKGS